MTTAALISERAAKENRARQGLTISSNFLLPVVQLQDLLLQMEYERMCEPRLSTRVSLALFGDEAKELVELEYIRKMSFADYYSRTAQPDFTIDIFQPKSLTSSSSDVKTTRDNFRFFIQQVGVIADGSAQEQDAARTMYNIIVRHKGSKDSAYSDAVSYFGKITSTKFDLIRSTALDLYQTYLRNNPQTLPTVEEQSEFGTEIVYLVPKLLDSTAGTDCCIFAPCSTAGTTTAVSTSSEPKSSGEYNLRVRSLLQLCEDHIRSSHFTMESGQLAEEIVKMLRQADATEDTIQAELYELVGESGFEFMFAIMQDMESFKLISAVELQEQLRLEADERCTESAASNFDFSEELGNMMTQAQTAAAFPSLAENLEGLSLNQRRKKEKKDKERAEKEVECLSAAMQDPSMAYLIQAGFSEVRIIFV